VLLRVLSCRLAGPLLLRMAIGPAAVRRSLLRIPRVLRLHTAVRRSGTKLRLLAIALCSVLLRRLVLCLLRLGLLVGGLLHCLVLCLLRLRLRLLIGGLLILLLHLRLRLLVISLLRLCLLELLLLLILCLRLLILGLWLLLLRLLGRGNIWLRIRCHLLLLLLLRVRPGWQRWRALW
jgi:hypothetical protein